jgi:calcineurin-like phosphoesterase family protein
MRKTYIISDTHLKHAKVATYCQRPENFTELIHNNVMTIVKPEDTLIHVGDVGIDKEEGPDGFMRLVREWPGKKILVRGNHDDKSCVWYMDHGFDFACDAMLYRGVWFTHHPWIDPLPKGAHVNVHGHLHNVWSGFISKDPSQRDEFSEAYEAGRLPREYNRLFAVEYTGYSCVEMDKFLAKPDKYQARGPRKCVISAAKENL